MNRGFKEYLFEDIVSKQKGFLRGPFGGNLKKEIFVPKGKNTYKVYEQGVVLRKDIEIGRYNITEEYFNEKMYRFEVCPKDFLVSCSGANYGAIFQMPENIEKGVINQALLRIRLNNDLINDSYFDYFFSHHLVNQIIGKKGDSTIPNFPPVSVLKKLKIKIHSCIDYQKQIAKVLSDLDAKIEVNNNINQELEAMAKTLYDYWFVQFDFPDANGLPYKSSGGKMVFNEALKREIPEGWEVDSFSAWIKNDKSGDWGKETEQGNYVNKVSCIRGADLNGLNGKGEVKSPTRFVLEKNSHKLLEIGDFIIEISGGSPTQSTGRMAFITKETLERFENPLICSNFCKAVTLKDEKALYNFAYEWNRLYDAGVLFGWEGKTSGIKNLLFESFVTNHQVVIPDSKIMEQFYDKAKSIHAQIQTNLRQNQKLSELRDWLLPMLMNGQVTVGEVEQELGMVAEEKLKYGE
ncbi:restriction endonuclease subunit S [Cellulophaga lytica]|uniref:restriction endonuclease subunit S n=1 Tax=Cellulophaga lytica TaxID=979 RepID=UPI000B5C5446|nr:restriction endonuclease subunit S [Cellulophaga lytica]SNQ42835.1 Restriction modification system DNA specificity domain-containing protein [Cellulophaga lytica]